MDDHTKSKGTTWMICTFNEGEQAMLAAGKYPEWVDKVYGGLEECPTSKKIHFQGMLKCRSQQRFSAIKKFLPKARIEPAKNAEALRKYSMKAETSVGDKLVHSNNTPYYTLEMLLKLIAVTPEGANRGDDWKATFWLKVNNILMDKPYLVGALVKPDVIRAWEYTRNVWITHMTDPETNKLMGEEAIVLQPPQANGANVIVHVMPE